MARVKRLERAIQKRERESAPQDYYGRVQAFHAECDAWTEAYIQWAVRGIGDEPGPVPVHPFGSKYSPDKSRRLAIEHACVVARVKGIIPMHSYLKGMDQPMRDGADQFCECLEAAQQLIEASKIGVHHEEESGKSNSRRIDR